MSKILVVDDDVDLLEMVSIVLEKNGFEVVPLEDANNFHTTVAAEKPEAILMDVFLGKEDGRELCKSLKKETPQLPVILYSANVTINPSKAKSTYHADDFIYKPFDIKTLVDKLHSVIDKASIVIYIVLAASAHVQ